MTTAVMWFRRDLRLSDNPALVEAVRRADDVVALFVLDDRLWGPAGANRRAFLTGCLAALDESLDGRLVIRRGDPASAVAAVAAEVEAESVLAAADFGPYGCQRDESVARALAGHDRHLDLVGSPCAVPPGMVTTAAGEPYKVFSPYQRAWIAHGWGEPARAPRSPSLLAGLRRDPVPTASADAQLPPPGEVAAKRRARAFFDGPLAQYDQHRNEPGSDGTSRLSPYLKWGCIHPRQLLARLGPSKPHTTFRSELAWREFYADVLFHRPDSARSAFDRRMSAMQVDTGAAADRRFAAWAEGRTGYPIVDAGMRQLLGEGWMHNRVRMIVASFLVKDLHLDWLRGARHFMHHLVDGDLASNQHGWQWTAGSGTDAAPWFRIFNPVLQGRRFDPDGTYLRRWIPELAGLDGAAVHEPWRLPGGPPHGYPEPVVDHLEERDEALRRFGDLRGRTG